MHTISFGNINISIPGSWNELDQKQLLSLARLVTPGISIDELKTKLLFLFTGIQVMQKPAEVIDEKKYFWLIYKKRELLVSAYSLAFVTEPFLKLFKEEKGQYLVFPQLTKQLLPVLNGKYYGPDDGLSNITLAEFIHAETAYANFVETGDNIHLQTLIGTLYRLKGRIKPSDIDFTGDIREPFNDYLIPVYSAKFNDLNNDIKKAILWYYEGCKLHISLLFPFVFRKSHGEKSTGNTFRMFLNVVDELANNQPSENERIMKTQLYTALNSLNQRIEKSMKHE